MSTRYPSSMAAYGMPYSQLVNPGMMIPPMYGAPPPTPQPSPAAFLSQPPAAGMPYGGGLDSSAMPPSASSLTAPPPMAQPPQASPPSIQAANLYGPPVDPNAASAAYHATLTKGTGMGAPPTPPSRPAGLGGPGNPQNFMDPNSSNPFASAIAGSTVTPNQGGGFTSKLDGSVIPSLAPGAGQGDDRYVGAASVASPQWSAPQGSNLKQGPGQPGDGLFGFLKSIGKQPGQGSVLGSTTGADPKQIFSGDPQSSLPASLKGSAVANFLQMLGIGGF